VDALGAIEDDTMAAIQELKAAEADLEQRLLDGEITEDEHHALWIGLRKQTPREVQMASLKLAKTLAEAMRKDPGAADA
jgi:hypothetical protein